MNVSFSQNAPHFHLLWILFTRLSLSPPAPTPCPRLLVIISIPPLHSLPPPRLYTQPHTSPSPNVSESLHPGLSAPSEQLAPDSWRLTAARHLWFLAHLHLWATSSLSAVPSLSLSLSRFSPFVPSSLRTSHKFDTALMSEVFITLPFAVITWYDC